MFTLFFSIRKAISYSAWFHVEWLFSSEASLKSILELLLYVRMLKIWYNFFPFEALGCTKNIGDMQDTSELLLFMLRRE